MLREKKRTLAAKRKHLPCVDEELEGLSGCERGKRVVEGALIIPSAVMSLKIQHLQDIFCIKLSCHQVVSTALASHTLTMIKLMRKSSSSCVLSLIKAHITARADRQGTVGNSELGENA